jgi:uncharacterized membrane protein
MEIFGLIGASIRERKRLLGVYQFISIFGIILVLLRQFLETDKTFLFLLWNFFLAGLPLIFSSIMVQMSKSNFSRNIIVMTGIVWLLFLPNAPYMLTDYIHVMYGDRGYLLLDAFTLSWFAISAFIAAVISLNDISGLLMQRYHRYLVSLIVFTICLMCSFGIYLGRDLRFNSWDVIMRPRAIVTETVVRLSNPMADFYTWISATIIGLLLFLVYQGVKMSDRKALKNGSS